MALLPAAHIDYRTIVIEENATYYINQKPLDLIKLACFKGGSSYDGRRLAAMHELAIYKKIPVAINTHDGIYTFPTCSPCLFHCHWIFYEYIRNISRVPKVSNQCLITFKNCEKSPLTYRRKSSGDNCIEPLTSSIAFLKKGNCNLTVRGIQCIPRTMPLQSSNVST
ncbi:competence protein ComK [Salipaludibacillus sp. HK11]|uniref:competence protein ComK n=1 Tax=Salipaludibacillus sp. HK11 TaxID=3394320 RepID=UPI0039FB927A